MKHTVIETRSAEASETPEGLEQAIAAVNELRTGAESFQQRLTESVEAITTRLEAIETRSQRPGTQQETNNEPAAETRAFGTYLRLGREAPASELRTLTVSSDPQGGYLAPAEFSEEFIRNLVEVSPIRSVASVRTTTAPNVIYPARTGVTNAKWKGETQAQEGSEPAFGQAEVAIHELNTFVDISNQLLADSAGVAEQEVRLALAEDFGAKESAGFVTGTGVGQPYGLLNDPDIAVGKSGAAAAAIASDELIDLYYSLPALYRQAGTWAMNTKTLATVRKLKDGDGNYLWTQGDIVGGVPGTLLGRPVIELLEMDDIGANKTPIVFGDFSGYRIVDRVSMSILANPYLLATNGLTRFHATRRVGGKVIQPAKFKKFKNPAS